MGVGPLRRVEHQTVPLPLYVIVLRLLGDVEAVKLQLPGQLLLPLEDHQGHLDFAERQRGGRQAPQESTASAGAGRSRWSLGEPLHHRSLPRVIRILIEKHGQRSQS